MHEIFIKLHFKNFLNRMMLIDKLKLFWRQRVTKSISRPEYERAVSAIKKPTKPGDPPLWSIILALAYGVGKSEPILV